MTVVAEANAGYLFVNWTEGGAEASTSASYTFTASANRDLVANFIPIVYIVSTSSFPVSGGDTSGGGAFNSGDSATVIASPNQGYDFLNWSVADSIVSANAIYTFAVLSNVDLVATFVAIPYTITTSASPAAGGSTSGGGTFYFGDSVTVVAEASAGYSFVNWTEGGAEVSTAASYTFDASASRDLVANFAPIMYTVNTSSNPVAGGTTSGGGTFSEGANVTVVAEANAGYTFLNWTEGGAEVSTSSSYSFTASTNRDLVANFSRITYTITTGASPSDGGSTGGGGVVNSGDSVTVVAVANAGYSFLAWTEDGVEVSTSSSYTFTASADRTLVAVFVPVSTSGTIRVLYMFSPVIGGLKTFGAVMLAAPAPAGGSTVMLSSSNPSVLQTPPSVVVSAGQKWAFFSATTNNPKKSTNVTVTATLGSSQKSRVVRVFGF